MNEFFEIAYALTSGRLCLFTGTGFSKALSNDVAPSWKELLMRVCDQLENSSELKNTLFPTDQEGPLSLEEAAQIIDIELSRANKNIHTEIAKILRPIEPSGASYPVDLFFKNHQVTIVTTNYDTLIEKLTPGNHLSISPGFPIPRSSKNCMIYHIHGSIDSPDGMVATADDYFTFINSQTYFSRKLSTILHENTVVTLGYSLNDTNLKAIINDYNCFSRDHRTSGNILLVARKTINQHIKDYYAHCYGIRVIDNTDINSFFMKTSSALFEANKYSPSSMVNIESVLNNGYHYTDDFLRVESSFFDIIAAIGASGRSIDAPAVSSLLDYILNKKIKFTGEPGAWDQYSHLANWLIYLGSILDITSASIKNTFLDAVRSSMNSMSKDYSYGYSWHAYTLWSNGWARILPQNRAMVRKHIEDNPWIRREATEIVMRG